MSYKVARFMILLCLLLGRLKAVVEPLKSERFAYEEQLLEKVIKMEIKMEQMERETSQVHDKVKNTLNNLTMEIENKTAELKLVEERVSLPTIAFSAYGVKDRSLETNQILIFQNTYLNEGNGYDTVLGLFTAPVGGLYMFSAQSCTNSGQYFYYFIVVDGNHIARSTTFNTGTNDCGSVSTVTKLEKDQRVWVKCAYSSSSSTQIYDHNGVSSFSGVLLHG